MYSGDKKKQVDEYFTMLSNPNWRLDAVRTTVYGGPDLEVWRLPGEKIHRIMGVTDVDATPDICMEYFKDTEKVFSKLFPKIDQMFKGGAHGYQFLTDSTTSTKRTITALGVGGVA